MELWTTLTGLIDDLFYVYVQLEFTYSFLYISLTHILDEMGNRIDDLEKNIADLMTQAGVEERA